MYYHHLNIRLQKPILIPHPLFSLYSTGQWHTVIFGAKWDKDSDGWFKVWYDKKQRVDEEGITTFMDIDERQFQFRVGMYPNWVRERV